MSTTTTNFGLVKPELTDVADITQMNPNWDTIDNELKSHDDTIASLNDIINNLDASTLDALSSTLPTITDANTSIAESNSTGIKIERWSKTTLNTPYTQGLTTRSDGVIITAVIKGTFATQLAFPIGGRGLYIRPNLVGSIYDWTEYGDFKADGSVPMTGTVLNMSNGEGSIENNGIEASIRVRNVANDDSNSTSLILDNSFYNSPYRKLYLRDTVDGVNTDYKLYGEHNKDLMAESFLPLTGGTLTDELAITNSKANRKMRMYMSTSDYLQLNNYLDNNNYQGLYIKKETEDINEAIRLQRRVNGGSVIYYDLFGEHNPDLLATQIQSLMTGGKISMVRKIQRGIITPDGDATVTLSGFTNLNKMVVHLDGDFNYNSGSNSHDIAPYVSDLTLTSLTVASSYGGTSATHTNFISYQVIEYY